MICKRLTSSAHRRSLDTINLSCVCSSSKERERQSDEHTSRCEWVRFACVKTNGSAASSVRAKWSNIALVQQFSSVSVWVMGADFLLISAGEGGGHTVVVAINYPLLSIHRDKGRYIYIYIYIIIIRPHVQAYIYRYQYQYVCVWREENDIIRCTRI